MPEAARAISERAPMFVQCERVHLVDLRDNSVVELVAIKVLRPVDMARE